MDAYLVAQGLMNLVLALVVAAAAKALIPAVARSVAEAAPRRSDALASTVLTLAIAVLVPAAAGMALAAEAVIDVLAPGFPPVGPPWRWEPAGEPMRSPSDSSWAVPCGCSFSCPRCSRPGSGCARPCASGTSTSPRCCG